MKTLKIVYSTLFLFSTGVIFSAPAPPPSSTGGPTCWPPPCVPIDNGIIFLIVAGAAYGIKKIYDSRKRSQLLS